VVRAAKRALVVADMPFGSYENGPEEALHTAIRFMKETGAHAVKLEGGRRSVKQIRRIVRAGIPVMAHIGFTPQSEHGLGGHLIQGRGEAAAELIGDAHAVEDAGAFAVVLEMVPSGVAAQVTEELSIPTISVGAGPHCDGQLMVWTDWAGFTTGRIPKFVKQYANIADDLLEAAVVYRREVESGVYPAPEHEYGDA
jgi:3-methyl-2-oxobutanoate hydroxymethyltransferase